MVAERSVQLPTGSARIISGASRAAKRSGLWQPARWPDASTVRSMQRMIWDLLPVKPAGKTVEDYERESNERVKTLY